jgi:hypothetical protein
MYPSATSRLNDDWRHVQGNSGTNNRAFTDKPVLVHLKRQRSSILRDGEMRMKKAFRIAIMTIGALLISTSNSWASIVYDKVELFETQKIFTEEFVISESEAGTYQAILTDFEFPVPMIETGMDVTSATSRLGVLLEPGSFIFEVIAGTYHVSFFGFADAFSPALPSTKLGQYGIEITQVPIPAAVWLFCSGLLGLSLISRRDKAA